MRSAIDGGPPWVPAGFRDHGVGGLRAEGVATSNERCLHLMSSKLVPDVGRQAEVMARRRFEDVRHRECCLQCCPKPRVGRIRLPRTRWHGCESVPGASSKTQTVSGARTPRQWVNAFTSTGARCRLASSWTGQACELFGGWTFHRPAQSSPGARISSRCAVVRARRLSAACAKVCEAANSCRLNSNIRGRRCNR